MRNNRRGNVVVIILLVLLILAMVGGTVYYYFRVASQTKPESTGAGINSANQNSAATPSIKGSTNPADLDNEMKGIITDDSSVKLDPAKDTVGL